MSTFLMTESGRRLIAKIEAGDLPLKITRLLSGAGTGTNIEQQTGVISPMKALSITDKQVENGQLTITTIMTNEGLSAGYDMWQIGIYAEDPDDGEILYRVMQFDASRRVPAEAETVWAYAPEITIATGNASTVEVNVDQAGYASKADMEILRESLSDHIADTALHVTAEKQAAWDGAVTTANNAIPASQKGAAGGVATLGSDGKVPGTQLPDLNYDPAGSAAAVQGNLDNHTGNKGNPHEVTAAQVQAIPTSQKGVAGGVAELGSDGKVPSGQLPAMEYDDKGSAAAVQSNLNSHAGDGNLHVTAAKQSSWDGAVSTAAGASQLATEANITASDAISMLIGPTVKIGYAAQSGTNAVAIGRNAIATSNDSVAIGNSAQIGGVFGVAIGNNAYAFTSSTAIGNGAFCTGSASVALGNMAKTDFSGAVVIGNRAIGDYVSVAIGSGSVAGQSAVSIGRNANAPGYTGMAIGEDSTCHSTSGIAMGRYATVQNDCSFSAAFGYNARAGNPNIIRLGSEDATELSALYCVRNITVTSDERDKTDIQPVVNALDFLNSLQTVQYVDNNRMAYTPEELTEEQEALRDRYTLHTDLYDIDAHAAGEKKGQRKRVGLLAQDIQKKMIEIYGTDNYAELVHDNLYDRKQEGEEFPEGVEEMLAVNYTGFIPFLIKAVQELTGRIEKLEGIDE